MKIGIIGDTHIPVSAKKLPQKVYDCFKGCSLIIHTGDVVDESVIEDLKKIAETKAVRGNMDSRELKEKLPEKLVLEVEGKKIGVIHGSGPSFRIFQTVRKAFSEKPDIIIFGHSHIPYNSQKDGILFFNPGSATDMVFAESRSIGMIEINGGEISSEIITIDG